MNTQTARGRDHIAALSEAFPTIPRSIVVKADVLREGMRYTRDLEEAGAVTFPHSLIWNPRHRWNPHEGPGAGEFVTVPWKFDLPDGTPVVVRPSARSPYEIRRSNGGFALCRDGECIDEIRLEEKTDWLFHNTSTGTLMASVFLSWTRRALLGCALRYCEYSKTGDQCVYCCLDAELKEYQEHGIKYDVAVKPETAAETYRAALEEVGDMVDVSFTGGSLRNTEKEAEKYIALFSALDAVRKAARAETEFSACLTAPPNEPILQRLKDAGANRVAPNMDCWEERLWPTIVPGKHKYVGRQFWIDALLKSVPIFGRGWVQSNFVVGPETVGPHGFRDLEEGVESWRRGFGWLLAHAIIPSTSQWQVEVNSRWEGVQPPPVEYFLSTAQVRHELMEQYGAHDWAGHYYYKAMAWSTDGDFRRLAHRCPCDRCT